MKSQKTLYTQFRVIFMFLWAVLCVDPSSQIHVKIIILYFVYVFVNVWLVFCNESPYSICYTQCPAMKYMYTSLSQRKKNSEKKKKNLVNSMFCVVIG